MAESEEDTLEEATKQDELAITPELVRAVSKRVYEFWQRDMRLERERRRLVSGRWQQSR